jgi:homogentisate 1,2-dioxygenase
VLQSRSDSPGVDSIDFVIFPPRILAMQDTFPPAVVPSQHRQRVHGTHRRPVRCQGGGIRPRGRVAAQLHDRDTGPDAETFDKASAADTSKPHYIKDTMAFMFETTDVIRPTEHALNTSELQADYAECWKGLAKRFDPSKP